MGGEEFNEWTNFPPLACLFSSSLSKINLNPHKLTETRWGFTVVDSLHSTIHNLIQNVAINFIILALPNIVHAVHSWVIQKCMDRGQKSTRYFLFLKNYKWYMCFSFLRALKCDPTYRDLQLKCSENSNRSTVIQLQTLEKTELCLVSGTEPLSPQWNQATPDKSSGACAIWCSI